MVAGTSSSTFCIVTVAVSGPRTWAKKRIYGLCDLPVVGVGYASVYSEVAVRWVGEVREVVVALLTGSEPTLVRISNVVMVPTTTLTVSVEVTSVQGPWQ